MALGNLICNPISEDFYILVVGLYPQFLINHLLSGVVSQDASGKRLRF